MTIVVAGVPDEVTRAVASLATRAVSGVHVTAAPAGDVPARADWVLTASPADRTTVLSRSRLEPYRVICSTALASADSVSRHEREVVAGLVRMQAIGSARPLLAPAGVRIGAFLVRQWMQRYATSEVVSSDAVQAVAVGDVEGVAEPSAVAPSSETSDERAAVAARRRQLHVELRARRSARARAEERRVHRLGKRSARWDAASEKWVDSGS